MEMEWLRPNQQPGDRAAERQDDAQAVHEHAAINLPPQDPWQAARAVDASLTGATPFPGAGLAGAPQHRGASHHWRDRLHTLPLRALPAAVLAGALLLTAIAGEQLRASNRQEHDQIKEALLRDVVTAITAKLRIDQAVLSSVSGLFGSSTEVTRQEFASFYRTIASDNPSLEAITGVGFSRVLPADQVESFVQRIRREGYSDFRITPAGKRDVITSIDFLEPFNWRNRRAFGFDMFSEPVRREAMRRAALSDEPALTGMVTLLQETKADPQPGVLLYLPIYRTDQPLTSAQQRWEALLGWAYSPIRTVDLVASALEQVNNPNLLGSRVVVQDVEPGRAPALLFDNSRIARPGQRAAMALNADTGTQIMEWGGRRWKVDLQLSPHIVGADGIDSSYWLTITSGIAMGSVLSLVTQQLVTSTLATRRALADSERAATERAISSTVFEASSLAILVTNQDGYILTANNAFTQLTGYRVNEIVGQRSNLLKSGRHEQAFYKDLWDGLTSEGFWEGDLWNKVRSGELRRHHLAISSVRDEQLRTRFYVGMLQDITDRHAAEEAIHYQALHDTLTGLANRSLLMEQLEREVALAQRHASNFALLYIDLDGFKPVNDRLGHAAGDALLQQVAARLGSCTRESDMVCRQGGDEFVVLIPQAGTAAELAKLTEKLRQQLGKPFVLSERTVQISASIGVARFPDDGRTADALLRSADEAMYRAKGAGGGRVAQDREGNSGCAVEGESI
jgi:diguanylate cyclase (GGDEF)-like protein/PAS domain S-box-containing protein